MRSKRKAAGGEEAAPAGVRKAGVRKPAAKKAGALVAKRIVLRGRKGSSKSAEVSQRQAQPHDDDGEQQHGEGQKQQPGSGTRPAARGRRGEPPQQQSQQQPTSRLKRRSAASGRCAGRETIDCLSTEALQEVFLHLVKHEQQSYCREVLPLVCKRFRDALSEPCAVWESLHLDFIQKGHDLVLPALLAELQQQEGGGSDMPDGSNRRLLHTAVERWLKPRAAAVKRLVLSFSARDQTHSFPKTGHGLRPVLRLLAPTLQELCVAQCSDIFHAKSFADLAPLQSLETLAITFITGRVNAADLAPLEQLKKLHSLTLAASRQAEEGDGETCLAGFPESLLKLKGLTSLAVSSLGVTNLPVGITKLKSLSSLDVSGCPLAFLPSQLWKLSALRHLRLNGTNLMVGLMHTWEPLAKLPALESVELRDTKATGLPPMLTGLTALTSLDLSDNPFDGQASLDDGMQALCCLPRLQRLRLRCCQLPSVPANLWGASQLTHLDLSRNQLVELPRALSTLSKLRELSAEGNCFPRIPQVLAELPALETADLSFCVYMEAASSLAPLVADGGLAKLQRLDLRKMLGMWKASSIQWLQGLVQELEQRHVAEGGSPGTAPVVLWN